jgi:hypothetical protein
VESRIKLAEELKAIEVWDDEYLRQLVHDRGSVVAFESRQIRRAEILQQLRSG